MPTHNETSGEEIQERWVDGTGNRKAEIQREARRRDVQALSKMEGVDLDDPEVMAGAWRQDG